jgi:4-amino-4-deoxy-L-arabinose transferase-like glycosyltransferase
MHARATNTRRIPTALTAVLLAGLVLRLAILWMTPTLGIHIADEQHYHELATSLVEGRGFAFANGPTSLRPPAYPAFVAGIWTVSGSRSVQAVRAVQAVLGLGTAMLVFVIARRLFGENVGVVAAAITTFYPPFVMMHSLLLTETLFAFLLAAFVASALTLLDRPETVPALTTGILLALSALTRSITWPFVAVVALLIVGCAKADVIRRMLAATLVVAAFALVVGPWAIRNTRLQKVPVLIDTMGGMNLRMGNYEHTPHDRIWDAVSMQGDKSWIVGLPAAPRDGGVWTEGHKERWAREKAVAFMREHPGLTAWRAVIKGADFWGLDRDFLAGVERGYFSPPRWALAIAAPAMLAVYPIVVCLAVLGMFLVRPFDRAGAVLIVLLVLLVMALHMVVFGHPRYRLPLMPLLAVFAAAAIQARAWRLSDRWPLAWAPVSIIAMLVVTWTLQFVQRDWPHVRQLLGAAS